MHRTALLATSGGLDRAHLTACSSRELYRGTYQGRTHGLTDRHRHTYIHTYILTDRHRQTYIHTYRQTDRQTDRWRGI